MKHTNQDYLNFLIQRKLWVKEATKAGHLTLVGILQQNIADVEKLITKTQFEMKL